ncbi:MAG: hypothetical protein R2791_03800 [Saprospiraceae bacterium]
MLENTPLITPVALRTALLLLFAAVRLPASAQQEGVFSNLRSCVIDARSPWQLLDSLSIASPLVGISDSVSGQDIDPHFFSVEGRGLRIDTAALRIACPLCRRLVVRYRVLPVDLGYRISRLDTGNIRRNVRPDAIEFDYSPYEPAVNPWETGGIVSSGAYTRGLSFGNSQNLVFNSNLNLQLNGRLSNDLELEAALSDNSIPLQPDGTTRQLQEFDRIFIRIRKKDVMLTAGDYDLTRPTGYFSNYFKRLQGAMVEYRGLGSGLNGKGFLRASDTLGVRAAAAVSRGKFSRQTIQGQEGNQGPYRLQGAEGERFIIVLAGTEKVYIDGQLLTRGLNDDYVIDYNLGEVTFTARRLITKDSRIIVEFEYTVQTYLRSTIAANTYWNTRRGSLYFNFYSEQDSRNNGGAQSLSSTERRRLAEVGDGLGDAYASGIDTLADFDPNRVLYRIVDTVICGAPATILVYSTSPDSARYAARFTEVPVSQGNYVLALTAANGRVYRWSPPDSVTCLPTGNFEPVVRLIAPELRQLYAVGGDFRLTKGSRVQAELALSNRDLNRFSPLGDRDNIGAAAAVGLRQDLFSGKHWQGKAYANYEYTARNFLPLNPYRPAEFVRDWNTDNNRDTTAEQLGKGGVLFERKGWGNGQYEFGAFSRAGAYEGRRHFGKWRIGRGGYEFSGEINQLASDGRTEITRFSRPRLDLSKTFFRQDSASKQMLFKIGVYAEREKNERRAAGADTLSRTGLWYDLYRFYFQTPEQGVWQFGGFLSQRNDFVPAGDIFRNNTIANEANLNGGWRNQGAAGQQLNWTFTYRRLHIVDPERTSLEGQNTYLGRIDYNLSAWKNTLNFTTGYEIGSGQSPRVEFTYLAVNPGEGQYTWVDRNRDSILQIDEMEIAVFQDQANYVRVAVTTPDYIRTNNVLLNQNLRLEPRLLWVNSKKKWQRALSRFSTQSTLQINRRTFSGAKDVSPWNPFQLTLPDSSLVTVTASVRNVLFVNRANPAWDASIAQSDSRSQVVLTTGFERRRNAEWTLHGRLNLGRQWSVETDAVRTEKSSDNQAFDSRDFLIRGWEAGPKLSWLPARTFRIVTDFSRQYSKNTLSGGEKAEQNNWNAELTWNPQGRQNAQGFRAATSLRVKGTFSNIRYTGQENTAVAFTMLEGLQDGKNFLWSLNLDRQLSKSLQLSLNYEGRKTGDNKVVHVGRAQVRAVF